MLSIKPLPKILIRQAYFHSTSITNHPTEGFMVCPKNPEVWLESSVRSASPGRCQAHVELQTKEEWYFLYARINKLLSLQLKRDVAKCAGTCFPNILSQKRQFLHSQIHRLSIEIKDLSVSWDIVLLRWKIIPKLEKWCTLSPLPLGNTSTHWKALGDGG